MGKTTSLAPTSTTKNTFLKNHLSHTLQELRITIGHRIPQNPRRATIKRKRHFSFHSFILSLWFIKRGALVDWTSNKWEYKNILHIDHHFNNNSLFTFSILSVVSLLVRLRNLSTKRWKSSNKKRFKKLRTGKVHTLKKRGVLLIAFIPFLSSSSSTFFLILAHEMWIKKRILKCFVQIKT